MDQPDTPLLAYCGTCLKPLGEYQVPPGKSEPCPKCGDTARVGVPPGVTPLPVSVRFKDRHGESAPHRKGRAGASWNRDMKKWVRREYTAGKERNRYSEFVIDPDTGETIYSYEGSLDQHKGHGSDQSSKHTDAKDTGPTGD